MAIKKFSPTSSLYARFKALAEYSGLTNDQKRFFEAFFTKGNVFLTGEAGTGKSFCIHLLQQFCDGVGVFIAKTATTGTAALNIGGQTIHSWAGLGLCDEDAATIVTKASKNKKVRERVQATPVLFLDEVSTASADLLTKLDKVLKALRHSKEPFGGMKVVLCGDALQFPFIGKGEGEQLQFFFESSAWRAGDFTRILLSEQKRQDENTPFYKMLSRLRFGDTSLLDVLKPRVNASIEGHPDPVHIYCINKQVDAYNAKRYAELKTIEKMFASQVHGDERHREHFRRNCPAPEILRLKPGAKVMLLKNLDVTGGFVNGSVGVVKGFTPSGVDVDFGKYGTSIVEADSWEIKEQIASKTGEMSYKTMATFKQIPLKLCWASSSHKAQGQTLDAAHIDLSQAFEYGQHYVALSRVRKLEHMSIAPFSASRIKAHPSCIRFYQEMQQAAE